MKFFVPGASCTDEAEALLQSITRLEKRPVPAPDERIFRLTYEHNGRRYVAEVGQPMDPYYNTKGAVIAILGGHPLMICTPDRGVIRGSPILCWNALRRARRIFRGRTAVRTTLEAC